MRRDLWMILILGCLLILLLEAPAAFSSVRASDLNGPYSDWTENDSSQEARNRTRAPGDGAAAVTKRTTRKTEDSH